MQIQSLGFKTEMIFHRFDGVILDRGEYIVVKTPANPGFYFGNLLLMNQPPGPGSLAKWKKLFRTEFADSPAVKHFTFLWDSPQEGVGDVTEMEEGGFRVDFSVVLTAHAVHAPRKSHPGVKVRPIATDEEWRKVTRNQLLSKQADFPPADYALFKERQMARYRAMAEQGLGAWFGAFLGGELVGDLGIYREGNLGRFQSVETHPNFLRQGVCGSLVFESARFAQKNWGVKNLVMVADENYHAAKIYESVGFSPTAKEYSAFWWDKARVKPEERI